MSLPFDRFVDAYNSGELERRDPTWRGYAIEHAVREGHAMQALKKQGFTPDLLGLLHARAHWGIETNSHAQFLLGAWWVWKQLVAGKRVHGVRTRSIDDGHKSETKQAV